MIAAAKPECNGQLRHERLHSQPFDPYMIQRRGDLRRRREEGPARTHRRPYSMAGEPFTSLDHDPPALAGGQALLDDARRWAYDHQAWLLR